MSIIVYHLIYFRHLHSPDSTTICQSEDPSHTGVPVHLPVLWERVLAHDSANGHPHGEKQLQGMQQIVHLTVRLKAAKVLRWAAGAGQWSNRLCRPRTQRKKNIFLPWVWEQPEISHEESDWREANQTPFVRKVSQWMQYWTNIWLLNHLLNPSVTTFAVRKISGKTYYSAHRLFLNLQKTLHTVSNIKWHIQWLKLSCRKEGSHKTDFIHESIE